MVGPRNRTLKRTKKATKDLGECLSDALDIGAVWSIERRLAPRSNGLEIGRLGFRLFHGCLSGCTLALAFQRTAGVSARTTRLQIFCDIGA